MALTALNIIEDAFSELNVCAPAELSADDATAGLKKLNRLLDNWNADQRAVYGSVFSTYTLTPSLSPHTIGPTGTFVVAQRPVSIEAANLIIGSGATAYRIPLPIRDRQWWADVTLKALTNTQNSDLYYEPLWPNGSLFFWPISTAANTVELLSRVVLASLVLVTTFSLPPGDQDAVTLTLAEDLATPYHVEASALSILAGKAREARARIFANNNPTPRLRTADAGMPGSRSGGGWNYLYGGYK